jgi:hypothetical protein
MHPLPRCTPSRRRGACRRWCALRLQPSRRQRQYCVPARAATPTSVLATVSSTY